MKTEIRKITARTRKPFARAATPLLMLGALMIAVSALTGASPAGRRPTGLGITPTLGNYPNTSLPLSADATVTPDVAPTNATSMNVSTSTNFKGKLEGNPATGVVRVTDAHPAGSYTVNVTALNITGTSATRTFTLTVNTPIMCASLGFAAATNFGAGDHPRSAVVGDFNGDGKQDLATANYQSNNVSILLGNGTGGFGAATNFAVGSSPQSVAVGDFNGDGKQDLAVANNVSNDVSILLGDGTGSFSAGTSLAVGTQPESLAVGDFNGDGKPDLAVANAASNNVSILLGNGTGGFTGPTNFGGGAHPQSVAVGDFNGDGRQDLAVADVNTGDVSILLGDGAGSFSAATGFFTDPIPFSVAVGDFNGDGKQDLAIGYQSSANVSILLGDGMGSFSAVTNFAAGNSPQFVEVGDFNGDGKQDLATANYFSNNVSILLGDGMGGFSAATNFAAGSQPYSLAVGDFNGDGRQDLAVSNNASGNVSIFLRICVNHAPTGTNNTVTTQQNTAYTFVVADFGFSDPNDSPPNNLLAVEITTLPAAGALTLNGVSITEGQFISAADINAGRLQFAPAANTSGTPYTSFTFQVQDDGGTANNGADLDPMPKTLTINVNSSNQCMVCHKHTQTLILPCNSLELQRHLDHGDPQGACPNN